MDKLQHTGKLLLILIAAAIVLTSTSCGASKYGCAGQGSGFGWVGYK